MNVAQELGDNDLYDYDVLVRLLSNRFECLHSVPGFTADFAAITRMQILSRMPSLSCVEWDTHRAHPRCDKN